MNEELIVIKQLPVIEERLRGLSKVIEQQTNEAKGLVCTEDSLKVVKAVRADLNRQFNELEEQRKTVKKAVLAPYEAFEAVYKECVSDKFKAADTALKRKIDEVESGLKKKTEEELRKYYAELCAAYGIDFIPFEKLQLNITRSASAKSFREYIEKFMSKVMDDLAVIAKQQHKDEILAEYKLCLNLKQAVTRIEDMYASIEAEKAKREANVAVEARAEEAVQKVEALAPPEQIAPPAEEDDPVLTLVFRVTGKRSKLKALKQYIIDDGGFSYE
jgi:hypothetical protein